MAFEGLEEEDFFSVLSDNISKPLKEGKVVSMPNLGIFRPLKREDGSFHVSFTPSSFLRKRLNGENPVNEINSEKKTDEPLTLTEAAAKQKTKTFDDEKKETGNIAREKIHNIEKHSLNKNVTIEVKTTVIPPIVNPNIEKKTVDDALPSAEIVEGKKNIILEKIVFLVFLAALVIIVLFFLLSKKENKEIVGSNSGSPEEFVNLVDLAKENYGNAAFWVYIYEKNQDKLTSPINIPKGIKLTIPDLSEYNIDIKDSMEIIRANIRSEDILRKYKNKL
jgi:hypothetical protein